MTLAEFPAILRSRIADVPPHLHATRAANGWFALVEHAWHLADLEEEGYGVRLARLLREDNPALPDFRGDVIAEEREYIEQSLEEGLLRFERARAANVALIEAASEADRERAGEQEGVGRVTFAKVAEMMAEHDAGHLREVDALLGEFGVGRPG